MRKRTACLCCLSATLVVGGYVAWCGRAFYRDARIDKLATVPPEVMALAEPLLESEGLTRPRKFELGALFNAICRPYQSPDRSVIWVNQWSPDALELTRSLDCVGNPNLSFVRENGKWRLAPRDKSVTGP